MPRTRRMAVKVAGILVFLVIIALVIFYALAGFFDRDPVWIFPARQPSRVAAVLYSTDLGFRIGTAGTVGRAIAANGIPVIGFNSPTLFNTRKSQSEVNAIFADSVRETIARTGAARIIVVGGSYGADIVRSALPGVAPELRHDIAGAVLLAPGKTAFFGADPLGVRYLGTPDLGPRAARALTWLPVECVQGKDEPESLCPDLPMRNVVHTILPGGHYLIHNKAMLLAAVRAGITRIVARDAIRG